MEVSEPIQKTITLQYLPVVNLAQQQNHVPVVRELRISNTSEEGWSKVRIEVKSESDVFPVWSEPLESLSAGGSHTFRQIPIRVPAQYLANLTEKNSDHIILTVSANETEVLKEVHPIEYLAYDQWGGAGVLPELLAAFITPNHPQIPNVIRRASAILEKWTGNPSFDEYQSKNPNRVRSQMAALYEAIAEMQLIYASVPASFEEHGQRIRLADAIFSQKLANCLDISLFYAACLEAVGIHPLIIIVKGHAFVGAWLTEDSFADAVNDDPSLITKRTADGISEIVVLEATCMNAGHQASFDSAVQTADRKMMDTDSFLLFLDVKRARFSGIRPLPLRIQTSSGWEVQEEKKTERSNAAPDEISVGPKLVSVDKIEVTKQRLWERKLLDLSLRNTLLNVRMTKGIIQFITLEVGQIEDALANGEEFEVLAKPTDWDNGMRDVGLYHALHQSDPISELVRHELKHKRLRTYLPEIELQSALINVYRSSRVALEENGANTLYIGMGMLKWFETEASEKPRFAPILLIPVEIIRKSAKKGYVIRSREEETIMNITLLEMLRQDFGIDIGGLEDLPKDESGVDVKLVFNIIRQAIMTKSRWDVEEQAILGTFSFSKFILWNDIHNNAEKLKKNKVVASLISGKLEWEADSKISPEDVQDGKLHPKEVALPISTDSSQLHAIVSSGKGRSFVLHGPPGTGKSQTITNIIANALYNGKRVLFVAAKKAALEVVESRLESIGIGPFCLELHSNKSKKSAVLDQLKVASEVKRIGRDESFEQEAERLFALRNELNNYVEALHKKYPLGFSLFDVFAAYSQLPESEDVFRFPATEIGKLDVPRRTEWQDLAEELHTAGTIIVHPATHALRGIYLAEFSQDIKEKATELLARYLKILSALAGDFLTVRDLLKLNDIEQTNESESALSGFSRLFLELPDVPGSLMRADSFEQTLEQIVELSAHGTKRDQLRSGLLKEFQKDVAKLPVSALLRDWNLAAQKWFLPKWLQQNAIVKQLKPYSVSGRIEKAEVANQLQRIIDLQEEQEILDKATWLPPLLGFLWKNGEADWTAIVSACRNLLEVNRKALLIIPTEKIRDWRQSMASKWSEGSRAYFSAHADRFQNYHKLHESKVQTESELQTCLKPDERIFKKTGKDVAALVENWQQNLGLLKDWCTWNRVKDNANQAGLQPLVSAYENGQIRTEEVIVQFQKGLYRSAAEYIIGSDTALSGFNGVLFSDKIRRFQEISRQFETLTKQELYARLAAKIPDFTKEASQSSEIGALQKAIRNGGRSLSIRKLFDSIPNLLPRLTPCMLMSPISVAQYFEADNSKFDLVIFDEASQMPTCEAIGAIARAQQVIVVGDPKQMPPTSFFSTNNVDEENIEKEDLESILDDCLALSMPSQHLLWHYRSKHESLIAFSNTKYYDNKLLTFPSRDDIASKVRFVHVEGFYDKGNSRQNVAEAKAIIAEVVRRLSDPKLAKRSIGIVTFSSVQQILIDDMLTEIFASKPELEKTALESAEPLFIKNLENVQGDERDVILFSVGYGPDKEGKVSLNFGPINREGGWRRLNVAVSRARYEMKVFSTLKADQINLNRTGSEGVAGLKAFLQYAEKGRSVLSAHTGQHATHEISLEHSIAGEIRKLGFEVHTHIGSSSYRIDLGIVHPEEPSHYLLAILTDGKNYYKAATSRDREIVQHEVLKMLGWNVLKIWSTDWWENRPKVMERIKEALQKAKENKHEPEPEPVVQPSFAQPFSENETTLQPLVETSAFETYIPTVLESVVVFSSDDFLLTENRPRIKNQVAQVLEQESPISKNLLCKRVLSAWGISRLGTRISAHFDQIFADLKLKESGDTTNRFFWKTEHNPHNYTGLRTSGDDAQKRDAEDLPPEEVANGIKQILSHQISLPVADLSREAARLFGYSRSGANVETAMQKGIAKAIQLGMAKEENGRIVEVG